MSRYRVSFFQKSAQLRRSYIQVPAAGYVIRRAKSVKRAVEAAKRRYERLCHVADWRRHADCVELEIYLPSSHPR